MSLRGNVLDRPAYGPAQVEPREIEKVEDLQHEVVAPPRADHGQAGCRRHGAEPCRGKDLDVAAVADLGRPTRTASDETVEGAWLALEGQHDVKSTSRLQDAHHLAQHALRFIDVLQHIEDPDEIELAVPKRQSLRGRQPEIDALRGGACRRDRRMADVAPERLEVGALALDRFRDRSRPAADVQHAPVYGSQILQQVAQLA